MFYSDQNEFNKFILQSTDIPCKSKDIFQSINCLFIESKYSNAVEKILIKFNIEYYFNTICKNTVQLLYLEEYERSKLFNVFESYQYTKYEDMLTEIRNYIIKDTIVIKYKEYFISKDPQKEDLVQFPNLRSYSYSYFIFDIKNKQIIQEILKSYFNLEMQFKSFDIENEDYEISGLSCFEICDEYYSTKNNYLSYNIMCKLNNCNISFCILNDIKGKMSIRNEVKLENNEKFNYRPDLKAPFKSSWEANIARILNYKNIGWEYEKTSFLRYNPDSASEIRGYYFPDFFLEKNKILEVKGFWNAESRNKVLEFTKHYTDYHYYIVDQDMYINLKAKYQQFLPEWEDDGVSIIESETLQIVGLNFGTRKSAVRSLNVGDRIVLHREPNNNYDNNAILAFTCDQREIGHISKDWAAIYAPKIDLGMTFDVKVISVTAKVVNVKVTRNNINTMVLFDFFQ